MNIYKKLRKLKNDQNGKPLSMRALEKEIGINHAHISEIETGKRLPSINEIRKYHDYFGVSYDTLLGGSKPEEDLAENYIDQLYTERNDEYLAMKATLQTIFSSAGGFVLLQYINEYMCGRKESADKIIRCLDVLKNKSEVNTTWEMQQLIDV